MCQFETPLFIYYSYSTVIIITLIIAFSILGKNPKRSLNRNAFYFLLILALWTIGDLAQWLTRNVEVSYLFFRLSNLVDLFFLFFLYFSYVLAGKQLTWQKKGLLALPLGVTVFAVVSGYGIGSVEPRTCAYQSGWVIITSLVLDLAYALWASVIMLRAYRHAMTYYKIKLQIKALIFAIMTFILWSIAYEIVDLLNIKEKWDIEIAPYLILGNLFFVSLILFTMLEYDLFEFEILPRKWFTFAILSAIFGGMFFLALTPTFYFVLMAFYAVVIWLFWGKCNRKRMMIMYGPTEERSKK